MFPFIVGYDAAKSIELWRAIFMELEQANGMKLEVLTSVIFIWEGKYARSMPFRMDSFIAEIS